MLSQYQALTQTIGSLLTDSRLFLFVWIQQKTVENSRNTVNTRFPCLLFGNTPLIFNGAWYCSEITTLPYFVCGFPFLIFLARPRTLLKSPQRCFNCWGYNYIALLFKLTPAPYFEPRRATARCPLVSRAIFLDFQGVSYNLERSYFDCILFTS